MRLRQKIIAWIGASLMVAAGVYPPWACVGLQGSRPAVGYGWIFAPPRGVCVAINVDTQRLVIQWVVIVVFVAALYWVGPSPVPTLARLHSNFPWVQVKENLYRLDAPGIAIFVTVTEADVYEAYRKADGLPESLLNFETPAGAFAYADSMVPDEAMKSLEAKARWRAWLA